MFNPWVRKIPGGGHGNPLQYSSLEITKEGEPGVLPSMGSQKVRHDSATEKQQWTINLSYVHFFCRKYQLKKIKELPRLVTSMAHLVRHPVRTNSPKGQVGAPLR